MTTRTYEILAEALDTIKATFWVRNEEFAMVSCDLGPSPDYLSPDWSRWEALEKAIKVKVSENHDIASDYLRDDRTAKVTGVCSIGAIALANVTLYDQPLAPYEDIAQRDPHTYLAGAALAMEIWRSDLDWLNGNNHAETIANWNDDVARTRDEVVAMFAKALESPLASSVAPYVITIKRSWGIRHTNLVFGSEAEAREFLADTDCATALMEAFRCDTRDIDIVPFAYTTTKSS